MLLNWGEALTFLLKLHPEHMRHAKSTADWISPRGNKDGVRPPYVRNRFNFLGQPPTFTRPLQTCALEFSL